MSNEKSLKTKNTPTAPKKRFFNVEKRFGYTMHEIWRNKMSYALVAPFFIAFIIFQVIPLVVSTVLSLFYYNILEDPTWVGLDNFVYLFVDDTLFLKAFSNTMYYAVITGPTSYLMQYFFAWFINQTPKKLKPFYVFAFYTPAMTGGIVSTVVWGIMFASDSQGYLNAILLNMGLISEPVQWLITPSYIMPITIFVTLWSSLGTGFLSFVAGFAGVNRELYDAAEVDGVTSRFQKLIYVDIPQTMPHMLFAAILQITGAFSVGATMGGHPSPEDAGLTIMLHLGDYSGTRFEVGYASAIAVVLTIIIQGCGRLAFKAFGSKE